MERKKKHVPSFQLLTEMKYIPTLLMTHVY